MIRTRMLAASVLMVAMYGCGSVQPVAPQVSVESKHVFEKNYSLGVEGSAYVGEPIAKVKDYYEFTQTTDALAASEAFRLSLPPFSHADVPVGTAAVVRGTTTKNGKTYRVIAINDPKAAILKFLLNEDGSLEGSAINYAGAKMGYSYHANPPTVRFVGTTKIQKVDTSKGWKNFELIFGGVTKDSINVLYREYTPEDLVRAAYTQNLVYRADSKTIRFRDIAITVREASNERFRYVVTADGLK